MSEIVYCDCEDAHYSTAKLVDGVLKHPLCGNVIRCEFSGLGDDPDESHPATQIHIDYMVCDKHLGAAVSNVADRNW